MPEAQADENWNPKSVFFLPLSCVSFSSYEYKPFWWLCFLATWNLSLGMFSAEIIYWAKGNGSRWAAVQAFFIGRKVARNHLRLSPLDRDLWNEKMIFRAKTTHDLTPYIYYMWFSLADFPHRFVKVSLRYFITRRQKNKITPQITLPLYFQINPKNDFLDSPII